jgi:pyruvate dehydrogenase E2 component (dihydrolipoamide acetyltransferase)
MPYTLRMPEVAANATHATLVCWNKSEGESIEAGQSIADVETDKAVVELPVEKGGVVGKLLVANGAEVPVGEPIAILLQSGESLTDAELPPSALAKAAKPVTAPEPVVASVSLKPEMAEPVVKASGKQGRVFSSPVARLLAKQHGIDLSTVAGSGPNGRVTKHDVVRHVGSVTSALPVQSVPSGSVQANLQASAQPMARVVAPTATRRTIAKRLAQSKLEVPHFYLRTRCDVEALVSVRRQINASRETPISINDFVIRACAVALARVPQMNVSWRDEGIHEFDRADISVAVDTPNGLLTPIIRDAGNKTLSAISGEIRELARIAREGRLQPAQFQGGTFSVSNLGMFGVTDFDAIINPPQAGILAVGAVQSVPVVRDGAVVAGQVMDVVLSVDHRVVDGAVAARWLAAFRQLIEQPVTMLI